MAINPLQIPGYQMQGDVNFSSLAQLPQVYQQAAAQRQREMALATLGQNPGDTASLYASGDLNLANLGMQLDRNKILDSRDQRDFGFRQTEAQRAQQNADRSFGQQSTYQNAQLELQRRQADRADDPTPKGWVKDDTVPGGYRPIGPARPEYLAEVANASAKPETTKEITNWKFYRARGGTDDFDTFTQKNANKGTTVNVGGGSDKQVFDAVDESAKAARAARTGLQGLREASKALEGGIISGAYADKRLGLQKVGALLGLDSSKIVNTETFRAAIAPQIAAMIKSTVGTANISNADREFAEKAAGGNINLDEGAIKRLVGIMERAGTGIIQEHQRRLETVYPSQTSVPNQYARERALFGVEAQNAGDAVDWRSYFVGQ